MKRIPIEDLMDVPLLEEDQKGDKVLTIYDALLKIKSILGNAQPVNKKEHIGR